MRNVTVLVLLVLVLAVLALAFHERPDRDDATMGPWRAASRKEPWWSSSIDLLA